LACVQAELEARKLELISEKEKRETFENGLRDLEKEVKAIHQEKTGGETKLQEMQIQIVEREEQARAMEAEREEERRVRCEGTRRIQDLEIELATANDNLERLKEARDPGNEDARAKDSALQETLKRSDLQIQEIASLSADLEREKMKLSRSLRSSYPSNAEGSFVVLSYQHQIRSEGLR